MNLFKTSLLYIGYIAILVAAIIFPNHLKVSNLPVAVIIMAIGALLLSIYRILCPIEGDDAARIRRLHFQQFISSLLFFATAYLMYMNDRRWILALLMGAVIDIILTFRTPKNK